MISYPSEFICHYKHVCSSRWYKSDRTKCYDMERNISYKIRRIPHLIAGMDWEDITKMRHILSFFIVISRNYKDTFTKCMFQIFNS